MTWVCTEVVGLDYWGRPIYRNLEAEMSTHVCQWMQWHPRSKEEADAQRRVLGYLLQVTKPKELGPEISEAQRHVLEVTSLGREQVRDEAQALVRYIEEQFP